MKISVIIPIYGVEQYIGPCLKSIMSQNCDGFSVECILVDDCSPDRSMLIAKEMIRNYCGKDIIFNLIRHDTNKGVSAARNTGMKAATGDFLFFVDSDDRLTNNALKVFLSYYRKNPEVDVVMGDYCVKESDFKANDIETKKNIPPLIIADKYKLLESVLRRRINRNVWNKLIRRSIIVNHNLLFDDNILYEDVIWTYRLFQSVSAVSIAPVVTYLYEDNPCSLMHTTAQRAGHVVRSLTYVSEYIFQHPILLDGKKVLDIAHQLFLYHWIMIALDVKEKYHVGDETNQRLLTLRKFLLFDSLKHFRLPMSFLFLTMFAPLKLLVKYRWFRINLDWIDRLVYKITI